MRGDDSLELVCEPARRRHYSPLCLIFHHRLRSFFPEGNCAYRCAPHLLRGMKRRRTTRLMTLRRSQRVIYCMVLCASCTTPAYDSAEPSDAFQRRRSTAGSSSRDSFTDFFSHGSVHLFASFTTPTTALDTEGIHFIARAPDMTEKEWRNALLAFEDTVQLKTH
ncbi:hypothetical protein TraAM80_04559 [Trypanosoma rangeli]|uniref:Uncharacterized protein n=1 Tax=Trypanosoma rangeli TaxID=5698 RepID=A0A3R7L0Y8_TRYRA|nr:uncharacterized protein TraAM80_04559 [Trypanosoma rangeli]RNF05360.1 hypothetical protein TraAM80_04559 [Trypanosoma rangeli]|eukprot:RNF05360.1 hypothetical protein TraAM80_04559 [Trypanosoma rangeli]